ncbi:MAG: hypothetical protein HOW73_44755 [Polyangiaceae bacterium]|nr:hypothetical protein [Polyangiaceae bacterium]
MHSALEARLAKTGYFVLPAGALTPSDLARPWQFAEQLSGEPPLMVERQVIRAVPEGRSFASTNGPTPLHNDLQLFRGRPADLQVLVCVQPATSGGTSLLLDSRLVVEALEQHDRALYSAVFEVPRAFPFIAGMVVAPTIARFGEHIAFLHAPRPAPNDPLFSKVMAQLEAHPPARIDLRAGEILVADNHRVLHGRTAFSDPRRELVRFLVWLRRARAVPASIRSRARELPVSRAAHIEPTERDVELVTRMVAGVSPGALARKSGVAEPRLYALRDALFEVAREQLGDLRDVTVSSAAE